MSTQDKKKTTKPKAEKKPEVRRIAKKDVIGYIGPDKNREFMIYTARYGGKAGFAYKNIFYDTLEEAREVAGV